MTNHESDEETDDNPASQTRTSEFSTSPQVDARPICATDISKFSTAIASHGSALNSLRVADISKFSTAIASHGSALNSLRITDISKFSTAIASHGSALNSLRVADISKFSTAIASHGSALNSLRVADISKFSTAIASHGSALNSLRVADISKFSTAIASHGSALNSLRVAEVASLSSALEAANPSLRALTNITPSALLEGTRIAANQIQPLDVDTKWADRVFERVLRIEKPWVLNNHPAASFEGFARLARLEKAARSSDFHKSSRLFQDELGEGTTAGVQSLPATRDFIAISGGFSEALISFAADAFDNVVCASFDMRLSKSEAPQSSDGQPVVGVTEAHRTLVNELEARLRQFCLKRLITEYGVDWHERAASNNKSRPWKNRRSDDASIGRPIFDLIYYLDFWELHDLIVDSKNWHLFEGAFRQPADFTASMSRLKPIRHAMAHGRPLGKADIITIISEVTRLMAAMGLEVFD